MKQNFIDIGEVIRKVLIDRRISKAELARKIGVKPQSVDYLLKRKSIDTDMLYKVSVALEYEFASLFSIKKDQTDCDNVEDSDIQLSNAKIVVEVELSKEDILRLQLKERIAGKLEGKV
jgi:transcriptional regulator with XRE-family HTH domain